jgi:hypothetical protein
MNYKLNNGFTLKLKNKVKKVDKTCLEIRATGYHGDADYDVNKETQIYFNDNKDGFKELIAFLCFEVEATFDQLKEEYQNLFKDEEEFNYMYKDWKSFCRSYSEMHDQSIDLDIDYWYVIEGVQYSSVDVGLDIFKEDEGDD